MTDLFYAVLRASFQGSIVILAVLLLRLLLKRAPKSVFCLLWLLAGLRLMLPFEIRSSLSLQPQLQEPELGIQMENPVKVPDFVVPEVEVDAPEVPPTPVNPGNNENVQNESFLYHENDGVVSSVTFGDVASHVWMLGMGVMVLASGWSYFKLKRRVRMAYLIENGCFECPGLDTAFVLGFLPPKIYLPAGLTDGEKKFIFDHENTHIARGDHWYKLLGYLVLSLHWFNPLVWVGYSLLCRDIELACDEQVVRFMNLEQRKAYSAALLSCGGHTARIAACPVAFGESNPRRRIMNVLNYKRPGFWISLAAVVAVIFVAVCLLTSPKVEVPSVETDPVWNLEMKVEDVTTSGLQVQFHQTGIFPGCDRANLMYGSEYSLEKWKDGEWEAVEMLPQEYEVAWTTEAYLIELNSTRAFNLNWEWLYGQLPAGHYRIGKGVSLHQTLGETEHQTFYAEFDIQETKPVWNMEMTDEEFMELCRNAVAEFQRRESYHISETLVYYVNEKEDSRTHASYWGDGTNWARQFYNPRTEETKTHLYFNGQLYARAQKNDGDPTWKLLETDHDPRYGMTWLHLLQWDAQLVTFEHAEQVENVLHVFFTVHSTVQPLGWDDVNEYTMGFFFDQSGRMTTALMGALRDGINVMSDLKIETTSADSVRTKLEQMAQQRPADLMQELEDEYYSKSQLIKCAEALRKCQEQGYWNIEENRYFPDGGSVNDTSSCVWYISGNSLLCQNAIPEDAGHWDLWQMCHESNSYHRQGFVTNGPEFGQSWETEWNKGLYDSASVVLTPWPLRFDWSEAKISYEETERNEDEECITFSVLGDPMLQNGEAQNYRVAFHLDNYGNLKSVRMWYLVSDAGLMQNTIIFRATGREDILDCISQCHAEALWHTEGICNDPDCTNSTHHHDDHHH